MFEKRRKKRRDEIRKKVREKLEYKMKSENVAIPEIHTKDFDQVEEHIEEQEQEKEEKHSIQMCIRDRHISFLRFRNQLLHIIHRSKHRINRIVIGNIITVIHHRRPVSYTHLIHFLDKSQSFIEQWSFLFFVQSVIFLLNRQKNRLPLFICYKRSLFSMLFTFFLNVNRTFLCL